MRALRFGIVGTNRISDMFAEAVDACADAVVTAVCSRSQQTGEAFAARHGIAHVYTSVEAMAADDTVDAVYIATPNICHAAMAKTALLAGRHVLCEKPITQTASACDELITLARAQGCVLLEAMRPAFDPAYDALRQALPRIGTLRRAHLQFCQYSSRYDAFRRGEVLRAFDPQIGNCALADIGIYPLHVALSLFGEPQAVKSASVILPGGFEGAGEAILTYASETHTVSISYSKIADDVTPSVLQGEEGSITVDKLTTPSEIYFYPRKGTRVTIYAAHVPNNMVYEIEAFCAMVRGERCADACLSITQKTMRVYDTIVRQNGLF